MPYREWYEPERQTHSSQSPDQPPADDPSNHLDPTPVTYPLGAPDAVIVYKVIRRGPSSTSALNRESIFENPDVARSMLDMLAKYDGISCTVETWVAAFRACAHCNNHECWHFLRKVCDGIQEPEAP